MEQTPCAARLTHLFYAIESTAKRAEPERSIAQLADQCSTRPFTNKEPIVSAAAASLASCASKQQFQSARNLVNRNDHAH